MPPQTGIAALKADATALRAQVEVEIGAEVAKVGK
eukprot:SAG31_NODE_3663_length_4010_cov_4.327330_2_plen_35_part_00